MGGVILAKGLYTNSELIDTIIVDLNNLLKLAVDGRFIQACSIVTMMSQRLVNLKKTIDDDLNNRNKTIEILKNQLRECGVDVKEIPAEKLIESAGADNGSN